MFETTVNDGALRLEIQPESALLRFQAGDCAILSRWGVVVREENGRPCSLRVNAAEVAEYQVESTIGVGRGFEVTGRSGRFALTLQAVLYHGLPFLTLRIGLTNHSSTPVPVIALQPLVSQQIELADGALDGWVNGFHSWSYTGFVPHTRVQPRMVTNLLTRPHAENLTTRHPRSAGCYVGEWVGALIDPSRRALVAGFIGVERMFGQVYADGRPSKHALLLENTTDDVLLQPETTCWGEWSVVYVVDLPDIDPLGPYADAVARLTPPRSTLKPPTPGWSSWYQFFANVTAEDMDRNLAALTDIRDKLPLTLFQLDDGYQPAWGNWLEHNERFPQGVQQWSERVRRSGLEPGLWLSPFTIDSGSRIFKEHREAVIRSPSGRPVHAGFLLTRWIKGLDPTHPATQEFVNNTIETIVHRWGIKYLKLDFLYCGALPGSRYNKYVTRAEGLRQGFELIRQTAGDDVVIVGCGCPLGPAVGIMDIMRVSPDVAPDWYPRLLGVDALVRRDYGLPAARNSITMSINRSWTGRRWWRLDADNLLVREEQNLDVEEVRALATVAAMTDSHLVISDDLPNVPDERLLWAARLLPFAEGRLGVPEQFGQITPDLLVKHLEGPTGSWTLIALCNWEDSVRVRRVSLADLGLTFEGPFVSHEYWSEVTWQPDTTLEIEVPCHGTRLVALRPLHAGPMYLGSNLHYSMGAEVSRWVTQANSLRMTLSLGRKDRGSIWIWLPAAPAHVVYGAQESAATAVTNIPGVYRLPIEVDGDAEVVFSW